MTKPPTHTSFAHLHAEDVAGIRAAAQLIMASAGGLVVLVFAGFQFTDLPAAFTDTPWRAGAAAGAGVTALALILTVMRRAAAVLVPDRMLIDDLLTAATRREVDNAGASTRAPSALGATRRVDNRVDAEVLDRIEQAAGWLLPPQHPSLDALYQASRETADPAESDRLRQHLVDVASYARAEAARIRWTRLVDTITGPVGVTAALALVAFVALAS